MPCERILQSKETISHSGLKNGIAVEYSQHTTCSVIIQEDSLDTTFNGTKFIFQDILEALQRVIPDCQ